MNDSVIVKKKSYEDFSKAWWMMTKKFPVLVCGGRDYDNAKYVYHMLYKYKHYMSCIIEGGAKGADSLARHWAKLNDVPVKTFKADWKKHGKAAGPIRNKQMLDEGKPCLVIAFPGGTGTSNMISQARARKIYVLELSEND